ncbi:PucR family transcriptional regulator [Cohnella algarum]|uniref:PucR family transcriptional regulator n=1 Tax=Cohnella algarum TaxID=2044859 RepID=UPI00196816EF|nr:PucR family transcriptional regulator ligand-binding domain-containing protein [Cohnella algarum]MBN2984478.1 PucR family transcriptional regulator ligand-binding domain-containing protein [Cohnella algarum]
MAAMPRKETASGSKPEHASLTVKELLMLPLLKQAKLIAGERGVSAAITRISLLETADVSPRVRMGELLLAGGAMLREQSDRFRQMIPDLVQRGCAAIGFKPDRPSGELPKEVAEEAAIHGLPIVELPYALSFSDLVRSVMERLLAQESVQLTELQGRIHHMTRLLLDGNGLYAFLDAMENMLGNPVAIVRDQDKPWLSESLRSADAVEVWPFVQMLAGRHAGKLSSGGFTLMQNVCRVYASPVPASRFKPACLVLLERNREIQPLDVVTVDRLASLTGLELANVEAVREVEGKYVDQFLQDWLSGKLVSEQDWKLRAEVCGCSLPEETPLCAVLAGFGEGEQSQEKLREMARKIRSERLQAADSVLSAPVGADLVLIVPVPDTGRLEARADITESGVMQRLHDELRQLLGEESLRLFAGRPAERPEQLSASLSQARRARQAADVCGLDGNIVTYDRLGVYSLLYLIPSSEERDQFLQRFSIPLQHADKRGGGRLVETLEMFFRCNGNIKLTSEKLYAHYNTVVYRLEKIQNILGISLDDPEDRLQLQLSLKLCHITPGGAGTG